MERRTYLAGTMIIGLSGCIGRQTRTDTGGSGNQSVDPTQSDDSTENDEQVKEQPSDVEIFDDFSDLSHWTVTTGSVESDDQRTTDGSHSARLEAGTSDSRAIITRELSEPIDCTDSNPGLSLAGKYSTVPTIQLIDASGDRVDFRRPIKGDRQIIRHNFGIEEAFGEPDLSAVTEIRIVLWVGDQSNELWVDELHFVPRPNTGKVMIQFDDGYETDYTEAFPILERYGFPAVTFVNPGRIGNEAFLDVGQCERLQDAGWTVANHSYSHAHLEDLDPDEQTEEIIDAKDWLLDHGFEHGARYFAYPFGEWDDQTLDVIDEQHELAFGGGRGVHGHPVNPLLCSREPGDPTAEAAKEALDMAAKWGGHVRLFYHRLDEELRSDFEATIEHVQRLESVGEIEIVMPRDIEDALVG